MVRCSAAVIVGHAAAAYRLVRIRVVGVDEQRRIRVAVVFGGRSSEHAISCISAGSVLSAIDRTAYDVVPIGITTEGRWVVERDEPERLRITDGRLPEVDATGSHVVLPGDPTHGGIDVRPADAAVGLLHDVDVVFPVLHGPWGEDGTIQGLLELAGIPYVGSGVFASAAAMDKGHMKAVLLAAGLEVGPYELVTASQWRTDPNAVLERLAPLGLPVFVKPARAGSSVGITRVSDPAELPAAIEAARAHDPRVIVEAGFLGVREIECGVLDGADGPTGQRVRGDRGPPRARLLRLRGQVPRGRRRPDRPRRPAPRGRGARCGRRRCGPSRR